GLDSCVDSSLLLMTQWLHAERSNGAWPLPAPPERRGGDSHQDAMPGLTTWRSDLPVQEQIRQAGWRHRRCGAGTLYVVLPEDDGPTVDAVWSCLKVAWHETSLIRIVLTRPRSTQVQLVAPWENEISTGAKEERVR